MNRRIKHARTSGWRHHGHRLTLAAGSVQADPRPTFIIGELVALRPG